MKKQKRPTERLSAYLDDDLTEAELEQLVTEQLSDSETGISAAARYQMIGDALRGELSDASLLDVSAQVREALRNEPFDAVESVQSAQRTSGFNLAIWLDGFFGSMARPLAGMAVAVSVAVVMVFTVVQTESPGGAQQLAEQSPQSVPVNNVDTLVAKQLPANNESVVAGQQTTEFDRYLVEHAEFAAQDTIQGRIPYVRAVSYEAE